MKWYAQLISVTFGCGLCYLGYYIGNTDGISWLVWVFGITGVVIICSAL